MCPQRLPVKSKQTCRPPPHPLFSKHSCAHIHTRKHPRTQPHTITNLCAKPKNKLNGNTIPAAQNWPKFQIICCPSWKAGCSSSLPCWLPCPLMVHFENLLSTILYRCGSLVWMFSLKRLQNMASSVFVPKCYRWLSVNRCDPKELMLAVLLQI